MDGHNNFGVSTVLTPPSPATSGTSIVLAAGEGARFTATPPYNCTVCPIGVDPTSANAEIIRVTARVTDTLTILRAQEGTAARTIVVGDRVALALTSKMLTDIAAEIALKAALASPALTGVPTAPTAAPATNTTQVATTAFVIANAAGGSGAVALLATRTASGSATLDFASVIDSTYDTYVFEVENLVPATNNVELRMQFSIDNGATWSAANYAYVIHYVSEAASSFVVFNNGGITSYIALCGGISNAAAAGVVGTLKLHSPSVSGKTKQGTSEMVFLHNDTTRYNFSASFWHKEHTAAVNAVRFLVDSGNIASGIIRLYGYTK